MEIINQVFSVIGFVAVFSLLWAFGWQLGEKITNKLVRRRNRIRKSDLQPLEDAIAELKKLAESNLARLESKHHDK